MLTASNLENLPNIRHGFFTSAWGNCGMSGPHDQSAVAKNRAAVAARIGVGHQNLLSCWQIHSADVVTVTGPWVAADRPKADAMVTREPGIGLGILTADCVPLLLADSENGIIGAAHAGWRGALGGVIENTIEAMEALGASRRSTLAALGPCIAQESYEVGPAFPAPFLTQSPHNSRFFRSARRRGHYMFNLPGYVQARLNALGVASVAPSPADTLADEAHFFSYRRACLAGQERAGNLISVIALRA
ncbi:MAG: peptidoglycan editing factor PgeF [Pseudomonadota bacterium]|nr:peptidoglycan editing factor PgeF [Pseudomonadota bacterium]